MEKSTVLTAMYSPVMYLMRNASEEKIYKKELNLLFCLPLKEAVLRNNKMTQFQDIIC